MTSDVKTEKQIKECVDLLQKVLGEDLLAIYRKRSSKYTFLI